MCERLNIMNKFIPLIMLALISCVPPTLPEKEITTYKRIITINNKGMPLTNYQVPITLNTQDIISAGKMRMDCGDIRLYDSNPEGNSFRANSRARLHYE